MTLADYITARLGEPFCYGRHDCVLFAFGWLEIKTGKDLLSDVPKWKNHKQAQRVIASVGGLKFAADKMLTRIEPNLAKDGDIGFVNGLMCIFSGNHLVAPDRNGLEFFSRMMAEAAWTI